MSYYQGTGLAEGASIYRPPLFDGKNYSYWKNRMSIFLQSSDFEQWKITLLGPYEFTKTDDEGNVIPKSILEYDANDIKKSQYNAKALNSLHCALSMDEYNKISSCTSAKEIWDKLEVAHEGTSQVKEDNINLLVHDYELFKMEPHDSLASMFSRFSTLTNALDLLGKVYSNEDKVRKILRILPKKWRPKVTAIQEAKNLKTLGMDELLGSLKIHEKELQREEGGEKAHPLTTFALKLSERKDGDMALLSRKFEKFLGKKKYSQGKHNNNPSSSKIDNEERKCFHCNEPGHYKSNCPVRRDEKREKKEKLYKRLKDALKGHSSESDEDESDIESSNEEETSNLCLMAKDGRAFNPLPHR